MSRAIPPGSSCDKPRLTAHVQQLTPSPKRKVVTVALFRLFEFLWGLPVVPHSKVLLLRHILTRGEKFVHLFESRTFMCQRLTKKSGDRKCRLEPTSTAQIGTKDTPSSCVVCFRNNLRDQSLLAKARNMPITIINMQSTLMDCLYSTNVQSPIGIKPVLLPHRMLVST
jgi:hypothetical protein